MFVLAACEKFSILLLAILLLYATQEDFVLYER